MKRKIVPNYKEFLNERMEEARYKSDEDIHAEFNNVSIQHFELDKEYKYYGHAKLKTNPDYENVIFGDVTFDFPEGDESVGGGSESTTENFSYNTKTKELKFATNNWYPDDTYLKMVELIKEKLAEEYNISPEEIIKVKS